MMSTGSITLCRSTRTFRAMCLLAVALLFLTLAGGCSKKQKPQDRQPEVTVVKVAPADTPVTFEFVAQTQSSHEVEIRARVNGFLGIGKWIHQWIPHVEVVTPKELRDAFLDELKNAVEKHG